MAAVRGDSPVVAGAEDALAAVRAAVAARESYHQNQPIRLAGATAVTGEGASA